MEMKLNMHFRPLAMDLFAPFMEKKFLSHIPISGKKDFSGRKWAGLAVA